MRTDRVRGPSPVADDRALKLPGPKQDILQKIGVIGTERPIHTVIGGHHRPRLSLLDRDFKRTQVELPHRPLVDFRAIGETVMFLVVQGEVLQAGPDAFLLHAFDIGSP